VPQDGRDVLEVPQHERLVSLHGFRELESVLRVLRDQVGPVSDRGRSLLAAALGVPLRGGGDDRGSSVADDEPVQRSVRVGHEDVLAVEGAGREIVVGGLEVVDQLRERQVG